MNLSKRATISLRSIALAYVALLVILPIAMILYRTFEPGLGTFWDWITTPAAISALKLSLLIVLITVPLNAIFGVAVALALVRENFPGKRIIQTIVDLPFAVSPVVAGVSLVTLWGGISFFGFPIIFALPGMVLATIFVTLPFVVREVEPVLHEIGDEQEQAAATLGASKWQTFRYITLPAIKWGLSYGVVLTIARALGEFGAVMIVASGFAGGGQTLTLLVHSRYIDDHNLYGSYAAATLLMLVSIVVLVAMTVIQKRETK